VIHNGDAYAVGLCVDHLTLPAVELLCPICQATSDVH
jgi:hypothetical protein